LNLEHWKLIRKIVEYLKRVKLVQPTSTVRPTPRRTGSRPLRLSLAWPTSQFPPQCTHAHEHQLNPVRPWTSRYCLKPTAATHGCRRILDFGAVPTTLSYPHLHTINETKPSFPSSLLAHPPLPLDTASPPCSCLHRCALMSHRVPPPIADARR
jgi:hypothetical protein